MEQVPQGLQGHFMSSSGADEILVCGMSPGYAGGLASDQSRSKYNNQSKKVLKG